MASLKTTGQPTRRKGGTIKNILIEIILIGPMPRFLTTLAAYRTWNYIITYSLSSSPEAGTVDRHK